MNKSCEFSDPPVRMLLNNQLTVGRTDNERDRASKSAGTLVLGEQKVKKSASDANYT